MALVIMQVAREGASAGVKAADSKGFSLKLTFNSNLEVSCVKMTSILQEVHYFCFRSNAMSVRPVRW